jgi:hypothetical protein
MVTLLTLLGADLYANASGGLKAMHVAALSSKYLNVCQIS